MSDTAGKVSFKEWGVDDRPAAERRWLEPVANWVIYSGYPRITMRLSDNTVGHDDGRDRCCAHGQRDRPRAQSFGGNGLAAGDHSFALARRASPGNLLPDRARCTDAAGNARLLQGASALQVHHAAAPP